MVSKQLGCRFNARKELGFLCDADSLMNGFPNHRGLGEVVSYLEHYFTQIPLMAQIMHEGSCCFYVSIKICVYLCNLCKNELINFIA